MLTKEKRARIRALYKQIGTPEEVFAISQDDEHVGNLEKMYQRIESVIEAVTKDFNSVSVKHIELKESIAAQLQYIHAESKKMNGDTDEKFTASQKLIRKEIKKLDGELRSVFVDEISLHKSNVDKIVKNLKKELEDLYWVRSLNGSNNVQAVLNIKSSGSLVANNVIGINFTNGTVVNNNDGTLNYTAPAGGGGSLNPQQPSGTINGINGIFTYTGSISLLFVDGVQQNPSEYTAVSGTLTVTNVPYTKIYAY